MRLAALLAMTACLSAGYVGAEDHPGIPERPEIIRALDGRWIMSGDVMGEPVTYEMVATPTLQGAFTELHMKDTQTPPKYEARVFIGHDPDGRGIIVHWMDSFGAGYSVPHGTGTVAGNTIQFTIPYESNPFRDTLTYGPDTKIWRLVIEAQQPDGTWRHFARYEIRSEQQTSVDQVGEPGSVEAQVRIR